MVTDGFLADDRVAPVIEADLFGEEFCADAVSVDVVTLHPDQPGTPCLLRPSSRRVEASFSDTSTGKADHPPGLVNSLGIHPSA
jgi:hypothetical protein